MYDTSVKLTFGGGKKYLGYKKLQGAQKTKKSGDPFFFFEESTFFGGAPKISAGGAKW